MFPELSQQALDEINTASEAFGLFAFGEDYGIVTNPQKAVNAFRSLFDLEKYPITYEMIFSYLKDNPDYEDDFLDESSCVQNYSFSPSNYRGRGVGYLEGKKNRSIEDMITSITHSTNKDQIIIIGEIHGWWEKGKSE